VPQFLILPLFSPFGLAVESIKEFGGASFSIIWTESAGGC